MRKINKRGFTLIELIVVLVILAIIALIVTPIVLNIIDKATDSANKRSVDSYGKAVELAMQSYKLEHGKYTYDFNDLNVEYSGNEINCDDIILNKNGSIFITKCKIDGEYVEDEKTNDGYYQYGEIILDYVIGDIVTYNNIKFYVINNSTASIDYITLLKAEPLTVDEVNTYGVGHVNRYTADSVGTAYDRNGYGGMAYYSSTTCGYNGTSWDDSGCTTDYVQSEVKYVVDAWAKDKLQTSDLKEDATGYSARLITIDELKDNLGYEYFDNGSLVEYRLTQDTPTWIYNGNYGYWTMSPFQDYENLLWLVYGYGVVSRNGVTSSMTPVRPVINLRKSAIE